MARKKSTSDFALTLTRVTRSMYAFIGFFALSIIIFDSGNLITREAVIDRWMLASGLFLVNTLVWFFAAQKAPFAGSRVIGIYVLAAATLVFAGFMTYWERGMASTSTIFYILPLLIVANLKNRHALLATAGLAAGTYAFAAVKYFNDFFNEGFRIQLWGNMVIICGTIIVSAWLIMILVGLRHDSK